MSAELIGRAGDAMQVVGERFGTGGWSIRPLAVGADGREVFEFARGDERIVAKTYVRSPGEGTRRILDRLSSSDPRHFRVPTPIAYDEARRILLMRPAEGVALESHRDGPPLESLARVGRALAELHAHPIGDEPVKTLADHIDELILPGLDVLAREWPGAAPWVAAFKSRAFDFDARGANERSALLHRDFHLRQLFDDGERVTVVDWDLAAAGDPAFDVAYLVAYLGAHFSPSIADQASAAFLEGYQPDQALVARLPIYLGFNCLRRACRRLRLRDAGWRVEIQRSLEKLRSLPGVC